MTHLGERVTALVDGRLVQDAAERALVHLAECATCREAVAAERAARRALRDAPAPAPPPELVRRLLEMGGPAGPLSPRAGHVPGAARPVPLPPPGAPWEARPAGRSDRVRPGGRRRLRTAATGVLSVATLGLVGLLLVGSLGREAPDPVALGAASLSPGLPASSGDRVDVLDDTELASLRVDGWPCPDVLGDRLPLVDARRVEVGGAPVLHLTYSDGSATVSVVEHRGRLDAAQAAAFARMADVGARASGRDDDVPWHAVWQSGDVVVAVVAEGPPSVVSQAVEGLPHDEPALGWWDRVEHGADVVGALLRGS